MRIIRPRVELWTSLNGTDVMQRLKACGRVCYKSEDDTSDDSAEVFVRRMIKNGHEAVLEHCNFTVKFIVDHGVSHEIVRHRLASYCQESTRYCNYYNDEFGKEITVIQPCFLVPGTDAFDGWKYACLVAETKYFELLDWGCTPQEASSVLPNSLKTELVMTANIREWRHFLQFCCAKAAHPQMREVATQLLDALCAEMEPLFSDIKEGLK